MFHGKISWLKVGKGSWETAIHDRRWHGKRVQNGHRTLPDTESPAQSCDLGNRGRSVLENSAAQKKRKGETGADFRSRLDRTFGDGHQRRSRRGLIASARVEHRGEALMLRVP